MKINKVLSKISLLVTALLMITVTSFAAGTENMGIVTYRKPNAGVQYAYAFGGNKKVFDLVKYNNGNTPDYDHTIYCLKAETGFFAESANGSYQPIEYNISANLKDKSDIQTKGLALPVPAVYYNHILWILDNIYMPTSQTAEADKANLMKAAGIRNPQLTDDDIDVVQQMALWFYTNFDDNRYHPVADDGSPILTALQISERKNNINSQYESLYDIDDTRDEQTSELFKYFVEQANANATTYKPGTVTPPVSLNKTTPSIELSGDKYIAGPYKINKDSNLPFTLEYTENGTTYKTGFVDENGKTISNYTLLDENKNPITDTTKTIEDLVGTTFYISVPKTSNIQKIGFKLYAQYTQTSCTYWTKGGASTVQPLVEVKKEPRNIIDENIVSIPAEKQFDLALRKFISKVNNTNIDRAPSPDVSKLKTGDATSATYIHSKVPVKVKKGDTIIYTIRIYNEGEVDGYAEEVTDFLPPELEFVNDEFNAGYRWTIDSTNTRKIKTDYLSKAREKTAGSNLIKAFNGTTLDYRDLQVKCKVKETAGKNKITNIAAITDDADSEGNDVIDRDSDPDKVPTPSDTTLPEYKDDEISESPNDVPGQEDDDDFEKVIIEEFDLSLRKYITEINGIEYIGRKPNITVTNLANQTETTAIYEHPKNPINLQRGDVITYTISVYNEGDVDGYVDEITDHLPPELEYLPEDEINKQYEWKISEDGRTVTTDYLSKAKETSARVNILKAFNGTKLDTHEVKIRCKVKDIAEFGKKLTNIAEITKHEDDSGNTAVVDRDSSPQEFTKPEDNNLPEYKDDESDKNYVPGQQDDDDFEKVRIVYFDLALRKFITAVNDTEVTNRIPELSMGEDGNIKYNHTKEPVLVENGNIVTYTLRIFNEGLIAGYASEVTDDVPDGLEFLPDHETNKEYRWQISNDGKKITTDYLSKEQEKIAGSNLIKAFDREKGITEGNPDYRDIKIAFKVTEPNTSDRILVNTAEISDDRDENDNPVDDIDSDPGNNNEWNEEDDLDKEFIRVKYFDLSLKKWVSKTIVIENGKETVTETGHTGDEDPEPIVKVDLHRKKLDKVIVKFEFQIKVTNEGEIAGYAKEVTDYVPEGLKFVQEDNKQWYIRDNDERKVGTRALENTLLQPGESASVPILLTWINGQNNIGLKTNIAEISEDYNDSNTPDIDSIPDNKIDGEDDIDDAPVMLAIELGGERIYFLLGTVVLGTMAIGIILIKKYVL